VRDEYCGASWETFSQALTQGVPGNEGCLGLYLRLEEIVPPLPYKGTFRVDAQVSTHTMEKEGSEMESVCASDSLCVNGLGRACGWVWQCC
jgi:hypothetical protein